jgi:hypothetical protein
METLGITQHWAVVRRSTNELQRKLNILKRFRRSANGGRRDVWEVHSVPVTAFPIHLKHLRIRPQSQFHRNLWWIEAATSIATVQSRGCLAQFRAIAEWLFGGSAC